MLKRKFLIDAVKRLLNVSRETLAEPEAEVSGRFELDQLTTEDFNKILKFGKPQNKVLGYEAAEFVSLPYGLIKRDLPQLQKQARFYDCVDLVLRHTYKDLDLSKATGNELMAFLLWIKEQQERLNALELNYLSSDPDPKMVAAGIHKLNDMGELPTIDNLAGGDLLKYEAIEALPYFRVYEKLKLNKIWSEINKQYEEIVKNTK